MVDHALAHTALILLQHNYTRVTAEHTLLAHTTLIADKNDYARIIDTLRRLNDAGLICVNQEWREEMTVYTFDVSIH